MKSLVLWFIVIVGGFVVWVAIGGLIPQSGGRVFLAVSIAAVILAMFVLANRKK